MKRTPIPYKCQATKVIGDEVEIRGHRCVLEEGHEGQHKTYYRYVWKNGLLPITWAEGDISKLEFYKDELINTTEVAK